VIALNPKDANTLSMAGEMLLTTDAKQSADLLSRAEQISPSAHSEVLLARAYQNLGQPQLATQYLTRARNRAPRNPEVLRAVAGIYRENHEYAKAIATLQALPNKTPDLLAELAYTYELAGEKDKAVETYLLAAKRAEGNMDLQLSVAQALVNVNKLD